MYFVLGSYSYSNNTRFTIEDTVLSYGQCVSAVPLFGWVVIFLSTLFWIFRLIRFFYHAVQYYDIKKFFNSALKIDDVSIATINSNISTLWKNIWVEFWK